MALGLVLVMSAPAIAQTNAELLLRIDRLEAMVRTLTGQIEDLTFRLEQLTRQVLALGGTVPAAAAAPPLRIDLGPATPIAPTPPELAAAPPTTAAPTIGAPLDLGQLIRGGDAPIGPVEPAAPAPLVGPAPTGVPVVDYERSYQAILNGDYAIAEAGFRAFIDAYPDHRLAIDARYWLGESFFARGIHLEAAEAFLAAYRSAPSGDKAPDALLKLGISLVTLGEVQAGCSSFAQVLREFPRASNALKQRVAAEQANARCA